MPESRSQPLPDDDRPDRAARRAADRRARRRRRTTERLGLAVAGLVVAVLAVVVADAVHGSGTRAGNPVRGGAAGAPRSPATRGGGATGFALVPGRTQVTGVQRVLRYTPYIASGSPRKREVALTFDDGPSRYTTGVVRALRRARAKATFFVVGEVVADFASQMLAASAAGFSLGNHTQTHPKLAGMDAFSQRRELEDQEAVVRGAGANQSPLFRPPYGSYDAKTLRLLKRKGELMVLWSVDTSDYAKPGVDAIVRAALNGARPGAIILMHDGGGDRSQTVAALPRILDGLRKRRLKPVTVDQLIADDPPPRRQGRPPGLNGG